MNQKNKVLLFFNIFFFIKYTQSSGEELKPKKIQAHSLNVKFHKDYLKKLNFPRSDKLKIYGYSDNIEASKAYLNSAKKFNLPINNLFYSKYPMNVLIKKFYALRHVINKLPDNALILFTDVFDVLFINNENFLIEKFKSFNCDLLIGAEKKYSQQAKSIKTFYDNMFKGKNAPYLNSGVIMGYCWLFKIMLDTCLNWYEKNLFREKNSGGYNDQTMLGAFFYKFHKKYNMHLDTDNILIWNLIPREDETQNYFKCSYSNGKLLKNKYELGIMHMPNKKNWGKEASFIFQDIQQKTY